MSLRFKQYDTYEQYIDDQVSKLTENQAALRSKYDRKYQEFLKRFARYKPSILPGSRILCLGARMGEEVYAWQKLGYDALGVDLKPASSIVIKGDWHKLPIGDDEFDVVYTNSIDHAYDIKITAREIDRVLCPAGILILELLAKHASDDAKIKAKFANKKRYESMLWNSDKDVLREFECRGFRVDLRWDESKWHAYVLYRSWKYIDGR